ncbi:MULTISPECIES: hypothetical protein [unclassified Gordonia (in: high G+C Gram-positive bacteria)]|uniref:hypothetical protein n=1 Tax=unclassified Gordonia (in: high G+C Gram-positive bacteria) TaxID=2657482 RepID=UPI001965159F|nr:MULTISPECIES: hypothetical protein [unclassified Gordonia (in: high G+C Gram-positive bacteria)]MBN0975104.1 hypothetical protein [Gordonia sp. BP-119]MBN0985277.1 hypothetical protein [Gordonia sp. BP-94]WGJ88040.1 hypothetical protein QAD21_24325 [Gordonia sp. SMJS1]
MARFGRVRSGVVALAVALCAGMLAPACGFQEPPYRKTIDANDATERIERRGMHAPDGFEFAQGLVWPVDSVGSSAFAIRYDGPADQFRTLRAADVSGVLSEFEDLPCASIPSPWAGQNLTEVGLTCPAGGGARISRSEGARSPDQSLNQAERAVVLNFTPSHTQLFVVYSGT